MTAGDWIIGPDDPILITGATGFIGRSLTASLLDRGFRRLRCLARPASQRARLDALAGQYGSAAVEVVAGNLLSPDDCAAAVRDTAVVFHLAVARGERTFAGSFRNSVVTTRNLLDAIVAHTRVRRFVNLSSFSVYSNRRKPRWRLLDESCPIEERPALRGNPYCFSKVKQDEIVAEYGARFGLSYVHVRPGPVYGPGDGGEIPGRVGVSALGLFLHLGGSNRIPFTYIDNCVDAIVLAGVTRGVDGEVFNVVDDDLPASRQFLRLYKRHVRRFRSAYLPHAVSYGLCALWEAHARWSNGQLRPSVNRRSWHAHWKRTHYSNAKLKSRLGWTPRVATDEALSRYFDSLRDAPRA
jgi:nucleoside-diphosphate-sugar epimerase